MRGTIGRRRDIVVCGFLYIWLLFFFIVYYYIYFFIIIIHTTTTTTVLFFSPLIFLFLLVPPQRPSTPHMRCVCARPRSGSTCVQGISEIMSVLGAIVPPVLTTVYALRSSALDLSGILASWLVGVPTATPLIE